MFYQVYSYTLLLVYSSILSYTSVRYTYNMGFGIKSLVSQTMVSDGETHKVAMSERDDYEYFDFKVDNENLAVNTRFHKGKFAIAVEAEYVYLGGVGKTAPLPTGL